MDRTEEEKKKSIEEVRRRLQREVETPIQIAGPMGIVVQQPRRADYSDVELLAMRFKMGV